MKTTRILFTDYPDGWPTAETFQTVEAIVPALKDGEILIETLYLSVDPYMRARMSNRKSYLPPFQPGQPIVGYGVGRVVDSKNPGFTAGDVVQGGFAWESHVVATGFDGFGRPWRKIPDNLGVPLSYTLGILGMPGMTAWVGTKTICNLNEGETLFVTAAAGAVGSVVGQIAKNLGASKVVGSAGGADKCAHLVDNIGFDAAIDYKTCANPGKALAEHFPKGIDVHFENTGGPMFEAAIWNMALKGRIALCGLIADYNAKSGEMPAGPRGLFTLIGRNVMMQGFIVSNYPEACIEWLHVGAAWLREGKLKYRETVSEGLTSAPEAFLGMMKGENVGKMVVQVKA